MDKLYRSESSWVSQLLEGVELLEAPSWGKAKLEKRAAEPPPICGHGRDWKKWESFFSSVLSCVDNRYLYTCEKMMSSFSVLFFSKLASWRQLWCCCCRWSLIRPDIGSWPNFRRCSRTTSSNFSFLYLKIDAYMEASEQLAENFKFPCYFRRTNLVAASSLYVKKLFCLRITIGGELLPA